MKKAILLSMGMISASAAWSQTALDWSVDAILAPANLYSQSGSNTTPIGGTYVFKNLGPGTALIGDTVLYQVAIYLASNNQLIVAAPNNAFFFTVLKKILTPGDTMQLTTNITASFAVSPSINVKYEVRSYIRNASRGLASENTSNNILQKPMVWYNVQGWPVSTIAIDFASASVSPTVFQNTLSVQLNKVVANEKAIVNIYDIQGKLVNSETIADAAQTLKINTESMKNGVYILKVVQGKDVFTTKVVKN